MIKWIKRNYHWVIAAVAIFQLLIYGGVANNLNNYHMDPVSESLNITRTLFSLAGSVQSVVGVFSALASGVILRRFGFRKAVSAGLTLTAGFYGLLAMSRSYGMLVLSLAGIGLANGLCFTAGVSLLLNGWFYKHRGVILGLVTAASGVGSPVLGFFQSAAIKYVSWRLSFGIASGALLLTALLVLLFVRNTPQSIGLRPYGENDATGERKKNTQWVGFPVQVLRKRPAYYLTLLCALLTCVSVLFVSYNVVPFLKDQDMPEEQARSIFSTMMLLLGLVKLGMGWLCDRIGARWGILVCNAACATGVLLILLLPTKEVTMYIALLVFSVAMPVTTMMFPLLSAELFGYQAQNSYTGVFMAMVSAASIIASPIANTVQGICHSYRPVFCVSVILSLTLCLLHSLAFWLVRRDRKAYEKVGH